MNVWKRIISSSVIYLGVRFSFGILSNFIFYFIFSPTALLLIKRAELFLRLPVILNFGASKYIATQGIKGELDKSLISNFLILKITTYSVLVLSLFFYQDLNLRIIDYVLLGVLLFLGILANYFNNLSYLQDKIHYLIDAQSIITVFSPAFVYGFGSFFDFSGWITYSIIFQIINLLYLFRVAKKEFFLIDLKLFSVKKLYQILRNSFFLDLNSRLSAFFEIFIFFFLTNFISVTESAILVFITRTSDSIVKLSGNTINKKISHSIVSLTKNKFELADLKNSLGFQSIGYFFVSITISIVYGLFVFFFIENFKDYSHLVLLSGLMSYLRLMNQNIILFLFARNLFQDIRNLFFFCFFIYMVNVFFLVFLGNEVNFYHICYSLVVISLFKLIISFVFLVKALNSINILNNLLPSFFLIIGLCSLSLFEHEILNINLYYFSLFFLMLGIFMIKSFFSDSLNFIRMIKNTLLKEDA
tara:strand:+ start:19168 stop:20586 length:1419 start_codon:yes stop_codon:yes gene_type:complete